MATVTRRATEHINGSATMVARPTQPTDGNTIGGATVATSTAATTARRAHGLVVRPKRARSAPPLVLAKHVPWDFFCVLGTKSTLEASLRDEFCGAVSCAPW